MYKNSENQSEPGRITCRIDDRIFLDGSSNIRREVVLITKEPIEQEKQLKWPGTSEVLRGPARNYQALAQQWDEKKWPAKYLQFSDQIRAGEHSSNQIHWHLNYLYNIDELRTTLMCQFQFSEVFKNWLFYRKTRGKIHVGQRKPKDNEGKVRDPSQLSDAGDQEGQRAFQ